MSSKQTSLQWILYSSKQPEEPEKEKESWENQSLFPLIQPEIDCSSQPPRIRN